MSDTNPIPDPVDIPDDDWNPTDAIANGWDPFDEEPDNDWNLYDEDDTTPELGPFARAARDYLAAGWSPVPCDAKRLLVKGVSGHKGRAVVDADVRRWADQFPTANVALRLPRDVVGLDVDAYGDKPGADTLAALVAEHGPLPPTKVATARVLPSGRYLYRVPNGSRLRSMAGAGVDICQHHHRYVVVAPSTHHTGAEVRWIDEQSGEVLDTPPEPDDLPELPWPWLEALSVSGSADVAPDADDATIAAWVAVHTVARRPGWLPVVLGGARERIAGGASRHDVVIGAACQMAREATAGAYAASDAVEQLRVLWSEAMDETQRAGEVDELIAWAVGQLATDSSAAQVAEIRERLDAAGVLDPTAPDAERKPEPTDALRLPASFWSERPVFGHIRQAALARMVAPDAVLGVVLARVAALTSHTVELPASAGAAAGLTALVALVGPPEAGKSSAVATARALLPRPAGLEMSDAVAIGSGEGLVELMYGSVSEPDPKTGKPTTVRRQVRYSAFVIVDEGTALAEVASRQGSTTLSTLRTAFTHGVLGAANANAERRRLLDGTDYVYGVVLGIQPTLAGSLFDPLAIGAGTPQRFLWVWCVDPSVTAEVVDWPGPLDWTPPDPGKLAPLRVVTSKVRHPLPIADGITEELRRDLVRRRNDADADPLDAHEGLVRLKVAALLGILDGRVEVSADDWRLAGVVIGASRATRHYVAATLRSVEATREQASTARKVRQDAAIEDAAYSRALASAALSVARKVHRDPAASERDLRHAIAGKYRQLGVTVEDAIARAVADGHIVADGEKWRPRGRLP